MAVELLLSPVAEVPVSPTPRLHSPFPHPRVPAHLDGHEEGYFKHVLYATLSPHPPSPTAHLSHYHLVFPLSSLYCSVLCDSLRPGRHVITLLDTKNSGQPVFFEEEEEEEKEEGKQTDTTSQLSGHSVRLENMQILPEETDCTKQELNIFVLYTTPFHLACKSCKIYNLYNHPWV